MRYFEKEDEENKRYILKLFFSIRKFSMTILFEPYSLSYFEFLVIYANKKVESCVVPESSHVK